MPEPSPEPDPTTPGASPEGSLTAENAKDAAGSDANPASSSVADGARDGESVADASTADADPEAAPAATAAPVEIPAPANALLVGTPAHVATLTAEILDPERTQPVIVVTAKPSADGPFVDADALAAAVGELASVWVLDDPDLTWTLTDALPPKLDVYGGAVRVYNPIDADDEEPYPSDHPQWTVFAAEEGDKVVRLIAAYVTLTSEVPLPEFGATTTATVTTVRKAGAELELATGHPGFVSIGHLIQHGEVFHAADVLQEGQEVPVRVGAWNPHAGRLSVTMREFAPDPWKRLAEVYEPGMLIEGGVSGVTDFGAFVELLPGVEGLLHMSKIADEFVEYVDDYVREGDRITVRLLDLDVRRQKAGVSLRDVPRGATPEPPASIFPGGPPWLPMPTTDDAGGGASDEASGDGGADLTDAAFDDDADGVHEGGAQAYEDATAFTDDDSVATPAGWEPFSTSSPADPITGAAVVAAGVALTDPSFRGEPAGIADADEPEGPGAPYGDGLALLFSLIDEHGAEGDLAEAIRDALERGITAFDARLDEEDEGSEDETDPLVQLRNAAADLIDALRVTDTSVEVGEATGDDEHGTAAGDEPVTTEVEAGGEPTTAQAATDEEPTTAEAEPGDEPTTAQAEADAVGADPADLTLDLDE